MKKFLVFTLTLLITLTLVGCGTTSSNLASNMTSNLNKLNNSIKNITTISDADIVISDLISDTAITTMRTLKPSNNVTDAESLCDVKNVSGNAFVVPNYNRNTDTYGNFNNNYFGYNGIGNGFGTNYGYMGGYNSNIGYGYNNSVGPFPYGFRQNYPWGNGYNNFNGNGLIGSNIDTYRDNINPANLYNRLYRNQYPNAFENNYYNGVNGYYNTYQNVTNNNYLNKRWLTKNINTYRNIASNINTYKNANTSYKSRYDINNIGYETDLNNHYQKLSNLCAIQVDTLNCNDQTNNLKTRILANISYLNSIAEQIKSGNIQVSENQAKAVKDLLNNANAFANKINTSKNEVNNELKSVNNMKVNYSANADELSSKYIRLLNSLDTRNSYLQNILSSLLQIENVVLGSNYSSTENNIINNTNNCEDCDCPYLQNSQNSSSTTMPPPKQIESADNIDGIIDIYGEHKEVVTDENGEIKETKNEYQDRYIIENGKISKYPKIKTDNNDTTDVSSHIKKDSPEKLENDDIKKLKIAGEKIMNTINKIKGF